MKLYQILIPLLTVMLLFSIVHADESPPQNDHEIVDTPITVPEIELPTEPSEPEINNDEIEKTDDYTDSMQTKGDTLPKGIVKMEQVSIPSYLDSSTTAFSIIIPSDWDYFGTVLGDNQDINFHTVSLLASSSNLPFAVEIFPATHFSWSDEPSFQPEPYEEEIFSRALFPTISAKYYIESILIPLFRVNFYDLRIIESVDLPSFSKEMHKLDKAIDISDGSILSYDAATAVVEYSENGVIVTEELFAVIRRIDTPKQTIDGVFTSSEYQVDFQIALKSPRDLMDENRTLLTSVLRSLSFSQNWYEIESNDVYPYDLKKDGYYLISRIFNRNAMNMITWFDQINKRTIEFPPQFASIWCNDGNEYVLCPTEECDPSVVLKSRWYNLEIY